MSFLLSPEDEHLRGEHAWRVLPGGYIGYCVSRSGRSHMVLLHRVLMNAQPGQIVDHRNRNPSDNRRENLRFCTHTENMRNSWIPERNTSGFKGVYRDRRKWRAEIRDGTKKVRLGSYETPEAASEAYKAAAIKIHGEFARF